jgi:hypothetical protein
MNAFSDIIISEISEIILRSLKRSGVVLECLKRNGMATFLVSFRFKPGLVLKQWRDFGYSWKWTSACKVKRRNVYTAHATFSDLRFA